MRHLNIKIEHLADVSRVWLTAEKKFFSLLTSGLLLVFVLFMLILFPILMVDIATLTFQESNVDLFGVFFFLMIAFGFLVLVINGILLGYFFSWDIGGQEIIEVNHNILKSQKTVFGRGSIKEYKKEQIMGLKLNEAKTASIPLLTLITGITEMFSGELMGQIFITLSDGKTDYLGFGLNDAQAKEVIEIIQGYLSIKNA